MTMKKHTIFRAILCGLIGLAAGPCQAQTGGIQVEVPFEFQVAGQTLPQGEYVISSAKDNVFIQNSRGQTVAMVLSNAISGRTVGKTGQVVFQCYDQRCFLSELWSPTQYAGRQVLRSRREEELAKKETAKYFTLVGAPDKRQH
jgi:hypothetical protein